MSRVFLSVVCVFSIAACNTQRMVCPAYQSSFIYDKEATRQRFSYFKEDSTPKIYTASKSRYLVAVPESYKKKLRKMQTVEMIPVYPVKPDSLKEDFSLAELDPLDSTAATASTDTTYAITKTKEKYNLDQDLYMWYFREMLVLPDVRAAMDRKANAGKEGPAVAKEKKGFFGFFKNLFKKNKKVNDSTATVAPVTDVNAPPPTEKKRGGLFKRKKAPDTPPAKKEGDGF